MKKLNKDQKIGAKYVLSMVRSSLTKEFKRLDKAKIQLYLSKTDLVRIDAIQYELDDVREVLKEIAEKIGV